MAKESDEKYSKNAEYSEKKENHDETPTRLTAQTLASGWCRRMRAELSPFQTVSVAFSSSVAFGQSVSW
jgi:hypothetical protein